jgi:glycosyltransferase involved in cell wall biosynthesis
MRVMYLNADPGIPVLGHKGASVHVRAVASALCARGAEVIVAAPRIAAEGDVLDASVLLAPISPVLPKSLADTAAVRAAMDAQTAEVLALVRDHEVDAIHERFSLFSDAGVRAAAAARIPHTLEVNAPLREEAERFRVLPHPALAAAVERVVLAATSQVLVVSQALVPHAVAAGADPARVTVLPNGVAVDVPTAGEAAHEPGTFTVGFAGSLKPWHGVEILLEAIDMAAAAAPGLRLEVVGHGPLADLVEQTGPAGGRLRYLGALPHRRTLEHVAGWDAGVAPYLPMEDFYFSPLKVLEYMAVGVCPVTSALGELPDLLGDGARGVLVEPGDAGALSRALVGLASDPAGARRMGAAARAHVLAHRGWAHHATRILQALSSHAVVPG